MPRTYPPLAERLWGTAVPDGDCLIYRPHAVYNARSGHAMISVNNRMKLAHRVAWELTHGAIPEGLIVMHTCDRPKCVNVTHLRLGTVADNNRDRDQKRRHVALRGESNGFAKLTVEGVHEIRRRAANGEPQTSIARSFGVHQGRSPSS